MLEQWNLQGYGPGWFWRELRHNGIFFKIRGREPLLNSQLDGTQRIYNIIVYLYTLLPLSRF